MTDPNKTVFISYRRSTSQHLARSIFMDLRASGWDAFFDVNTIDSGMFDRIILNQIAARAHFVLVLSRGALQRCANQGDWLRREIEEAMRLNRNIVLVTEEGFDFKRETKYLPESLKDLPRYNGLPLVHFYFDAGMETLRNRFLKQPFYGEIVPTPPHEAPIVQQRIAEAEQPQSELSSEVLPTPAYEAPIVQPRTAEAEQQQPEKEMGASDYYDRGLERQNNGELDGAIADYSEAIRLEPNYVYAYNGRGEARQAKGDLDGAIADYTEAIRLDPQDALAYHNRGNAHYNEKDYDSAIADHNEANRLDPNYTQDAVAYIRRGEARQAKGDLDGAIADYNEANRLDPSKVFAQQRANELKKKLRKHYDGAIADHSEANRLDPKHAAAYNNRGEARQAKGDLNGAMSDYTEAIRLNPQCVEAHLNRGKLRQARGYLSGAIADYQKYLDLSGGIQYGDQAEIERTIHDLKEFGRK